MKNINKFNFMISGAVSIVLSAGFIHAQSVTPDELKTQIDRKSVELQEITSKKKEVEANLEILEGKSRSLQKELKSVDYQLNQLDLGIRSSEINIEKLGLEIDALGFDIKDVEEGINSKKIAIAESIRKIQQRDNDNLLAVILRGESLSESLVEVQSLIDLNRGLSVTIGGLKQLQEELTFKLDETRDKKRDRELENQNFKYRSLIVADKKSERKDLLQQTKNQESLYQKQLEELEKRQAEIAVEINAIEDELRLKLDPSLLPSSRPGVLAAPVAGKITQKFGTISNLYGGKPHNGLDIGAPVGTPIVAAERGKVIMVADQDRYCYRGAYGKLVLIEHENNLTTLYAHLSLQTVKEGDIVERGILIGYVGRTGYATGPHLHLTVYASQTVTIRQSRTCGLMPYGAPLDPQNYL